jgi:hypothetical protein
VNGQEGIQGGRGRPQKEQSVSQDMQEMGVDPHWAFILQ